MANLEKIINFCEEIEFDLNFEQARSRDLNYIACDYVFTLCETFFYANPEGAPFRHENYMVGGINEPKLNSFFETSLFILPSFECTLALSEKLALPGRAVQYDLSIIEASTL